MGNDLPKIVKVRRAFAENADTTTLHLDYRKEYVPGQFLMIWLPGINEKPFTVAGHDKEGLLITVRKRGEFTQRLAGLQAGELVGVRGPYGQGFSLEPESVIVAGGVGFADVAPLADRFPDAPVLYGENTAQSRLYTERFPQVNFYTVDGTAGVKGFPTDGLEAAVKKTRAKLICACGPEKFLVLVAKAARALGVECELAMERYMKCGMGICGQCACGTVRVCAEGPVFNARELLQNPDFGKRRLMSSGEWENA
ncbi:MAG: dihydroorotate dehydrogenase electron transfer subunit [Candidatus Omnitrophica bacterium]|nr:dihydroorotate dehydrogenase electron transfer subunit [Candidatus Omnitrophota bacterium]